MRVGPDSSILTAVNEDDDKRKTKYSTENHDKITDTEIKQINSITETETTN